MLIPSSSALTRRRLVAAAVVGSAALALPGRSLAKMPSGQPQAAYTSGHLL